VGAFDSGPGASAHGLPALELNCAPRGHRLPRRGTPSLLERIAGRLLDAVRTEFDLESDAEITVECAPGQIAEPTFRKRPS